LLFIGYSPITALNRTYALSKVKGKTVAIEEAEKLGLTNNHLYHVLLGYLYTGNDSKKAIQHLKTALKLAKTERERTLIGKDILKCESVRVWEWGD
jgi:predicted RNA polymerase sigma factor